MAGKLHLFPTNPSPGLPKMKILSIVQSFPENIVTLSKFRGFATHPDYDYRVFCWDSSPIAWAQWASDVTKSQRKKVMVSGSKTLFMAPCSRLMVH